MKCTQCGADRAHESRFCSNCGSALSTAALDIHVGHASRNAASARNVRHVLFGALGGIWLGIAFVGALLVFVPREKRADRLFGAWLGTAGGAFAVVMVIATVALASSSGEATSTSARGDVVVGVMQRCRLQTNIAGERRPATGDDCVSRETTDRYGNVQRSVPLDVSLEVTVRTASATTYTVEVPPETQVSVGDAWPPAR